MTYITIPDDYSFEDALAKVQREVAENLSLFSPTSTPQIMFNGHKVLSIGRTMKRTVEFKIEGNDATIDQLYLHFLLK